ncbi:FRG domain-containing protein [candidate division KSB1 bacterium]|nr:FRG domain-containing protein [candidate division KSB1 bacterium]
MNQEKMINNRNEISSVTEFLDFIGTVSHHQMYRGQTNINWPLLPSIARYMEKIRDPRYQYSLLALEHTLIQEFVKYSLPYIDCRKMSSVEKLVHAQHFGLPTRLLDWTSNPLKALYFVIDDIEHDRFDGVVHGIVTYHYWNGIFKEMENKTNLSLMAFYPEILNERIESQEACFISFPLKDHHKIPVLIFDNYKEDIKEMSLCIIPTKQKAKIRSELNRLGVNERTIYRGLEGVTKWIKSKIADHKI